MKNCVVLVLALVPISLASCRNDPAVDAKLEWSCVRMQGKAAPIATPECLDQLHREQSEVLKYYNAVPVLQDGEVIHYSIIEKRHPSQVIL